MASAILPAYISIGIHSNHMDMTRFESQDDPGYISVTGELRRWIKGLSQVSGEAPTLISEICTHILAAHQKVAPTYNLRRALTRFSMR